MRKWNKKVIKKVLKHGADKVEKIQQELAYENELEALQIELLKLQKHIIDQKKRLLIILKGEMQQGKVVPFVDLFNI